MASGCVRYALLENLEHGLGKMRETMPDLASFPELGASDDEERSGSGSGTSGSGSGSSGSKEGGLARMNSSRERLDAGARALLDAYEADEGMMAEIRAFLREDIEVYDFAAKHYHEQWEKPLATC